MLAAADANPRGIPECQKGDEQLSAASTMEQLGKPPEMWEGKDRLAQLCHFGQDWFPCSSDCWQLSCFLRCIGFVQRQLLFLPCCLSQVGFIAAAFKITFLPSKLFIQMGLKFVLGAHYPEDKMSLTAKWEHSY